ncbi:MAG: pyrroline-5-carboxylate reductase [Gammaproteobacteria bacterium]|nr:MAG: pyrroline-5-carboxylate reductase [Gammaproteobacteria bacterium]
MNHITIGFIGAGNMARALAGGLLANGWPAENIIMADPDANQRQSITSNLGIATKASNNEVAQQADCLVLAVKPQVLHAVTTGLAESVQARQPLVVSIAAGIRLDDLEQWLGGKLSVVRAMPNTPALIGSGASGLFANTRVDAAGRDTAESLLRATGVTVWVKNEDLLDVVTALSGSGPAYFFFMMEALEQAAVDQGLDRDTAHLLTLETALGAAKMALESREELQQLRHRVTSPGGTTEAAVSVLESEGVRQAFAKAITAACHRSQELAKLFGEK